METFGKTNGRFPTGFYCLEDCPQKALRVSHSSALAAGYPKFLKTIIL
jgi:hypothetical protein